MYEIKLEDGFVIEATERELVHSENRASTLTFKLFPNSKAIDKLERFITKIFVFDDGIEVFDGHVIDIVDSMSNNGEFTYKVSCLSVLDYLNSISTGKWEFHPHNYTLEESDEEQLDPFEIFENMTIKKTLQKVLDKYNSNVTDDKKIFLGNVTVEDDVYIQSNRSKILNFMQELASKKEAFIDIRKADNKYYLDFLKDVAKDENEIKLGVNMTSISRTSNLENIVTRIIPLGADGLTIKSVNNGLEYVQDDELVAKYGVNDKIVKWDDVTVAENLKNKAIKKLKTINDTTFSVEVSSLDLSYIDNNFKRFKKSQQVRIVNQVLKIDKTYRLIEMAIDMDNPYNSELTFSNKPCSAINDVNNIEQEVSGVELTIEVMNDRFSRKISKGDFYTLFEQTTKEFNFIIGNDGTSVAIDKDGLTVKDGAIAIKNKNGDTVMWVDENGNLSVNTLVVFGDGGNTVNFKGKGGKSINFKSDDAKSLFINFLRGTDTNTRIGVYAQDALSDRSYQFFIEPGSTTQDNEPMVIIRGANSTVTENEQCILQVHGDIEAIRGLYIGQGESRLNVLDAIENLKARVSTLEGGA